jgi:anti-sigma factor (TIGR02949 family)
MMNAEETMDCRKAAEKLYDLLDGELTADIEQRLREHVADCPHCYTVADFEKRFLDALQKLRERGCCPEALKAKVRESLRAAGLRG